MRALDELESTGLEGVGNPFGLFFSPDGQWIGFFDGATVLKKVAATGGRPMTVSLVGNYNPRGASWSADDTIVFATSDQTSGLFRVAAAGGEREVLTTPNAAQRELDHLWPEVLPGGDAVLFTITTGAGTDQAQIAVLDLRTRTQKVVIRGGSHAHYVPTGHLVYAVSGTLRAVAFDLNRLEAVGTPVPILEQVLTNTNGAANVSLSGDGTLVYVPGAQVAARTLVWVDRQGRETPLTAPSMRVGGVKLLLSPGRRNTEPPERPFTS